jgi:tRNA pseudouridine32 synthase/23S rRNA pseudouridine746 synthase
MPVAVETLPLGIKIVTLDDAFLVVSKPSGLLSVPGRGPDKADCLSARVQAEFPEALVVHRLDMETSGLMVFARSLDAQRALNRAFEQRLVEKYYVAVVTGIVENDQGTIDLPLICDWPNRPRQMVDHAIGKPSTTHYVVLASDEALVQTRVGLTPITGRSHQLRVHMASLGHAIIGDSLYSITPPPEGQRLLLHAAKLSFPHPVSGDPVQCISDVPF